MALSKLGGLEVSLAFLDPWNPYRLQGLWVSGFEGFRVLPFWRNTYVSYCESCCFLTNTSGGQTVSHGGFLNMSRYRLA